MADNLNRNILNYDIKKKGNMVYQIDILSHKYESSA